MNTIFISILVILFIFSFICIGVYLNWSSRFVFRIKKYHAQEFKRLGWHEIDMNEEGFTEDQVLPCIRRKDHLKLSDKRLNKIANKLTSAKYENIDIYMAGLLLAVVVIGVSFGVFNA